MQLLIHRSETKPKICINIRSRAQSTQTSNKVTCLCLVVKACRLVLVSVIALYWLIKRINQHINTQRVSKARSVGRQEEVATSCCCEHIWAPPQHCSTVISSGSSSSICMLGLLQYVVVLPEDNLDPFPFTCSSHTEEHQLPYVLDWGKAEKYCPPASPKGGARSCSALETVWKLIIVINACKCFITLSPALIAVSKPFAAM